MITCCLQGYSEEGIYAGRPAYDDIIQALCGFASLQSAVAGEPRYVASVIADKICGIYAAFAIVSALFKRHRSGKGQQVTLPMLETMVAFTTAEHMGGFAFDPPIADMGYESIRAGSRRPFRTRDGFLSLLPYTDAHWGSFCRIIRRPDLISDPSFASFAARTRNSKLLFDELSVQVASRTTSEWLEVLAGSDIPHAIVNGLEDLLVDPHLQSVGFWHDGDHPSEGRVLTANVPIGFSETPGGIRRMAPKLGQHTAEILRETAFTPSEVVELTEEGGACASPNPG